MSGKERLGDEQFSTMAGESDAAVNPLVGSQGSLLSETLTAAKRGMLAK